MTTEPTRQLGLIWNAEDGVRDRPVSWDLWALSFSSFFEFPPFCCRIESSSFSPQTQIHIHMSESSISSLSLMPKLCHIVESLWNSSPRYQSLNSKSDLLRMQSQLRSCTYRFRPMYRYWLPKSGGRLRPITQPDASDLLLLRSLFHLLSDYWEPKFHCSSHGFRPNRGCLSFFSAMRSWCSLAMLQKSDVVGCFDKIPHDLLLSELRSCLGAENEGIINLISSFLRTPILDKRGTNYASSSLGIPQGSPVSPVLMNIYLHSLDVRMGEFVLSGQLFYLRYADDILLGFNNRDSISRLTLAFNRALNDLELEVKSNKIWRQEKRRSSEIKVLGIICCITPGGQISARAPFEKWEKKLSLTRIEKKMEEAPKTLATFFPFLLSIIKVQLHFFFGCPCAQTETEIVSFYRRILRRRSFEFLRRFKPSDAKKYRRLLAHYERELLALVPKIREHRASLRPEI